MILDIGIRTDLKYSNHSNHAYMYSSALNEGNLRRHEPYMQKV